MPWQLMASLAVVTQPPGCTLHWDYLAIQVAPHSGCPPHEELY